MIILKNISNPGLARIPISFASSDITNYIRNLCLWCKMKYMLLMFIHLFSSWYFCSACAGTSQGSSLSQSLQSQKENEPSPPSASETEVRPSRQVFRKFDQQWQKNVWNSENRNGITRVIENLEQHKRWIRVPTRLMVIWSSSTKSQKSFQMILRTFWNAYDGDMQRPVIYQQQLWAAPSLSSPFLWLALVESNLLAAVESARPWGATGADKPKGGRGLRLQAEQQDVAFQPAGCQEKSLRGNPDL